MTAVATASSAVERTPAASDDVRGSGPVVSGHVSIPGKVLQKMATAVVAETLRVRRADVRVEAADDAGQLALRVSTPVRVPMLSEAMTMPEGGVVAVVRDLQSTLTRRVSDLAGRTVSRVDVTVSGSRLERTGHTS
ncbi:hypothetical protein [Frigoribacterium sp. RIT-PI-h]|uniref:hypothetical protein n=1 Tax=Frigoribacterium sp. RIT-PI-h TaxID=1690245 RepID=UPI0006B9B224|nr:hypothetical protein [Frigoribacterium sp. RIT-PI-h]KPG88057.1 hypothetical protein AEQ27_01510 [Frigoribacterium sp. RIT-PI-h]